MALFHRSIKSDVIFVFSFILIIKDLFSSRIFRSTRITQLREFGYSLIYYDCLANENYSGFEVGLIPRPFHWRKGRTFCYKVECTEICYKDHPVFEDLQCSASLSADVELIVTRSCLIYLLSLEF
ncbi:hypothetical protein PanWU01x14_152100 [Parasponia andersonii]|uniref:Uncharacterized protein n=1 Tax=Parasponia andersonii TaxID=3476 RepID=A0A2P5CHU4_PARAD|nr:hypothetical protein PanWU01x14_152100 [Parasponia andersonii]